MHYQTAGVVWGGDTHQPLRLWNSRIQKATDLPMGGRKAVHFQGRLWTCANFAVMRGPTLRRNLYSEGLGTWFNVLFQSGTWVIHLSAHIQSVKSPTDSALMLPQTVLSSPFTLPFLTDSSPDFSNSLLMGLLHLYLPSNYLIRWLAF